MALKLTKDHGIVIAGLLVCIYSLSLLTLLSVADIFGPPARCFGLFLSLPLAIIDSFILISIGSLLLEYVGNLQLPDEIIKQELSPWRNLKYILPSVMAWYVIFNPLQYCG